MSDIDNPQNIVEEFSRAYRGGRYDKVYDLYSGNCEFRKMFSREAFISKMRSAAQRTKMRIIESKVGGSEVRGNTARITLLSLTKSIVGEWHMEEEFTLGKEEQGWRILKVEKVRQWPVRQGGTSVRGRM